jgi:hypothetical protein
MYTSGCFCPNYFYSMDVWGVVMGLVPMGRQNFGILKLALIWLLFSESRGSWNMMLVYIRYAVALTLLPLLGLALGGVLSLEFQERLLT